MQQEQKIENYGGMGAHILKQTILDALGMPEIFRAQFS